MKTKKVVRTSRTVIRVPSFHLYVRARGMPKAGDFREAIRRGIIQLRWWCNATAESLLSFPPVGCRERRSFFVKSRPWVGCRVLRRRCGNYRLFLLLEVGRAAGNLSGGTPRSHVSLGLPPAGGIRVSGGIEALAVWYDHPDASGGKHRSGTPRNRRAPGKRAPECR